MKRFSWKKVVSLLLVAALVIGGLHFGARTVSAEEEKLITGQEGHALPDYEVPAVQYSFDRATVSEIQGTNGKVNIILVVDASNSMTNNRVNGNTRLKLAKDEAKAFAEAILNTENLDSTFFVYSFNKSVTNLLPGGSSDLTTVSNAIDDISSKEGTNISKGLYEALAGVTDKDSTIMVFLSDGEATWATTQDGSQTYGPTYGNGVTNQTKTNVKNETEKALRAAVAGVKDIYAISYFNTDPAVSAIITKTLSVVDANGLATQFGAIADEIKKNATNAKLIAEVGKYVDFSRAVDAEGNVVENVKSGLKDDGVTRIFTWDIPAPASLTETGTEKDITSPIVEFTINTSAEDLIEAWKNGDDQVSVDIVTDAEGKTFANITLVLTATTILSYTQTIKDTTQDISEEKTVNLDVQSFIYKVDAITDVPVNDILTVNYFIDGAEKPVASVSVEVPYGYELTEEKKNDNVEDLSAVVDDPNFDADLYEYKETTIDAENNVVNVYYVSKPIMVDYTVKYICEEEIDEANQKDGVVAQYSDSVADNTPITIKSFADVDVLEGVDKTKYVVVPEQKYDETVGVDNHDFVIYVVKTEEPEYVVRFLNNNGDEVGYCEGTVGAYVAVPEYGVAFTYAGIKADYTTYTFKGWALYEENKTTYTTADIVDVVETIPEGGKTYIAVYTSSYNPPDDKPTPIIIITDSPTPTPTEIPTEDPTPTPTEIPTEDPTPTPEPEIEIEETETPEGDVEIDEPETPEGAPEEEVEVEPIDTPQGDLPKTGVTPAPVFFGIGAACVLFGSVLVIKRRKEEN